MAEQIPKKQHTVEYIAIGTLVAVALIIGTMRLKKSDTDDEVFSRKEFKKKWAEVETLESRVPKSEDAIAYNLGDDKLPFKSPFDEIEKTKEPEENITLPAMNFQGMVWKSSRPQAIIDNKVYDVKDVIKLGTEAGEEDVIVKGVTAEGIHLMYKNKEFIVKPK